MKRNTQFEARIRQWTEAGLIDDQAGARILAFEAAREERTSLGWPVLLALSFGGILLAAGITLFVAAHWDELSPSARFSMVLLVTGGFQLCGALLAGRFPALSATLHAVGTASLGAAIFLTAQIFNLHEDWTTGILLWAVGAAAAYLLLRQWSQALFLALLAPAWLISRWVMTTPWQRPLAIGLMLTALSYLSARMGEQDSPVRRTLVWIGGIALVPCVFAAIVMATTERDYRPDSPSMGTLAAGWIVALAAPLLIAWFLRGRAAWINALWAAWAYLLIRSAGVAMPGTADRPFAATAVLYGLCALGSAALVVWGLEEKRKERLNLGVVGFAISVLFFYFDGFMGKLGRSASLLILGVLCLAGGYALEVTRRKLVARLEGGQ